MFNYVYLIQSFKFLQISIRQQFLFITLLIDRLAFAQFNSNMLFYAIPL
jgi:hypothetical protein